MSKGRRVGGGCDKRDLCEDCLREHAKGFLSGWEKGWTFGKAEAVLRVLQHREITVSDAVRKRVFRTDDHNELQSMFDRACIVESARQVFVRPEARSRRGSEAEGEAKGRARARAEDVLGVLEHRGLPITVTLRRRVLACRDELELQQWFDRAFTVASAKELLEPAPVPSRRRSSSTAARTGRARAKLRLVPS